MSQIDMFNAQIANILEGGQFSEKAVIALEDDADTEFTVYGFFYSGSYEEERIAPYSATTATDKEFFQLSASQLADISTPWTTLKGVILEARSTTFRISEVYGKRGEMLTLELQEVEDDD